MATQAPARRSWHQISYDTSRGLMELIKRAVGKRNLRGIHPDITPERFPLRGTGVRRVQCRVEAYLAGETSEEAATRLTGAGYKLGSTGDLAAFLHDHPVQIEKWVWVLAISEDSRWTDPEGAVYVPCAFVDGARRAFHLCDLRRRLGSGSGVFIPSEPT